MLFLTTVSAALFAVCLLRIVLHTHMSPSQSGVVIRVINRPYPWLAIARTPSFEAFHMESINLLMSLRSEGKVYRRSGLLVFLVDPEVEVNAISTIAGQLVWDKAQSFVAEWRQGGIVERENIRKR
jgi:hypothetical protein